VNLPPAAPKQKNIFKDIFGIVVFIALVIAGTLFINTFIFRSFNVEGPSSEPTMVTGDRLIVNRLPVTWAQLQNKTYIPERGQFIVFKNPNFDSIRNKEEYIVKRVIAYGGERVVLKDGQFTVYNDQNKNGFNPDDNFKGEPGFPTTGEVDQVVTKGMLFVAGDHRTGDYSLDSRNGLGDIPLYDVIGPVGVRIFPFDKIRTF
jgi:signal peptidase I